MEGGKTDKVTSGEKSYVSDRITIVREGESALSGINTNGSTRW